MTDKPEIAGIRKTLKRRKGPYMAKVAIIETGKGYSLSTTTVPETSAELSAKTGISKEAIRAHLSSMGGQFDADGHIFFEAEISAEIALSIFDGVEVKEVENISPDDPVLSEHPEEDEPIDEAEIGTDTATVTETKAEPEPVVATVATETVAETTPAKAKPEVTVRAIISPDFMSFTLTTGDERETVKAIAEKGGRKSTDLIADIYLCDGKIGSDDFISFDSEESANKAAGKINRLFAESPATEAAEDTEDGSETATKTTTPEKKEEEEVIPDFSDYKEKLNWELEKIKRVACKNAESPTADEMNFLASFMWYISCVDQRVVVDPSFAVKVLDKRLNLDLLNKFLMSRALSLLAPTEDGNIVTKEAIEAEKDKKKGKKTSGGDLSRFTFNLGDFMDNTHGVSRGLGFRVPDTDVEGWIYDFYDHEGDLLYKKIKAKKEKAAKDAAEKKKKAEKAAADRKKKAEKGKVSTQTTVTPSTTVTPAPAPEKAEVKTEAVVQKTETEDKPLSPSEIYGMDKPYEVMGHGFAQLNFMNMLS